MASAISHPVAAAAITSIFYRPFTPRAIWIAAVCCSIVPDLDFIGFRLGIRYGDLLGHRGLTHSMVFAALLAALITLWLGRRLDPPLHRGRLWSCLFLVTASHGVLDAFTNGGLGIAFFSPFSNERYFFPFTPILVSPLGIRPFLSGRGVAILLTEIEWIWVPAAAIAALGILWRRNANRWMSHERS